MSEAGSVVPRGRLEVDCVKGCGTACRAWVVSGGFKEV